MSDAEQPLKKHIVQFYKDDSTLVPAVGHYLLEGLSKGESCVVIATTPHWQGFRDFISSRRTDIGVLIDEGRVQALDAERTLSSLMVDGRPDPDAFEQSIAPVIQRAARAGARGVRAYGEMVDLLWQRGTDLALPLETLWNGLAEREPFDLMCSYRLESMDGRRGKIGTRELRASHTHAWCLDGYAPKPGGLFLMAEDDEDDMEFMRHVIQKRHPNVRVIHTPDGEAAAVWLREHRSSPPDLIMLDLNMPRKDGREVLFELRQDPSFDLVPVVILTTSTTKADERFADCFKNTYFFSKPIGVRNYEALLQSVLGRFFCLAP